MNIFFQHRLGLTCVVVFLVLSFGLTQTASPKILLYHSFDQGLDKPDVAVGAMKVTASKDVKLRDDGIYGKAAEFAPDAAETSLRFDLGDMVKAESGTIALWQILDVKEPLMQPEENLFTLLDQENKPIFKMTKSGWLYGYEDDKPIRMDCFDSLWWLNSTREHLAITWDAAGSEVKSPAGILRAFWRARPYAAFTMELKRKPAAIVIGDANAGIGVDELYVLDTALPQRAIWELMRQQPKEVAGLEKALAERCELETKRPTAVRLAAWAQMAKAGAISEAEANPGELKPIVSPAPGKKDGTYEAVLSENEASAPTASGRGYMAPADKPLTFKMKVDREGDYALALRYCLARKVDPLWPQNTQARTWWTENFSAVKVELDGKPMAGDGLEQLYPTGLYSGHAGDVEMWTWYPLAKGQKVKLSAGEHTVTVTFQKGLAQPVYDALLVSTETGPMPPYPRWVDQYRIPPAWWVEKHETQIAASNRTDTYTVILRNRCEEPCSYEIIAGPDNLRCQTVKTDTPRIELKPLEEKSFKVTFEGPAGQAGVSEWANIYLWNEDVALQQKYCLWNIYPVNDFEKRPHPVLLSEPDPKMQAALCEWLKTRDEKVLTPELKKWVGPHALRMGEGCGMRAFERPLLGPRLQAVDAWMQRDEKEIGKYLPDGPAEYNGYGTGWERVGIDYSGVWHRQPTVKEIGPTGNIDLVASVTVEGPDLKDKTRTYTKTYVAGKDNDIIASLRDQQWQTMIGDIQALAEAYYLTGDSAYAKKAFQMLRILARKYTWITKHFWWVLHREDRDWWGARIDGRYQIKYGMRTYQALGTYTLDLIWDALTPDERALIEHNVIRWGVYEGMAGPLFEMPSLFAAGNGEDMPYIALGQVLGDNGPREELALFFKTYQNMHPDGMHICSIGCYGTTGGSYLPFMKKLWDLGLDVTKRNEGLRNAFLTQPRFIFSGAGLAETGDGGGQSFHGLGANYGMPSREMYRWGLELYNEPLFKVIPDFVDDLIKAAGHSNPKTRAETMRSFYSSGKYPLEKIWPNVFIAPVKGIAMLRNRVPAEPVDWVEVLFDYGKYEGRCHGHPAMLMTIPSMNGQIVSLSYGYGIHGTPIAQGFHMRSYAYNLVVADEHDQRTATGPLQMGLLRESHSGKDLQWIDADSTKLYDGIYMRRSLFVTDLGIIDLFLCQSDKEHTYDWLYHSFGVARTDPEPKPMAKLAEKGPLTFAVNPRVRPADGLMQVTWENQPLTNPVVKASTALINEKTFVRLWALPEKGTTLHLFAIPIIKEVGSEIDYTMLRRKAKSSVFATIQEPWRETTGPKIKDVKRVPVLADGKECPATEGYALEITRTNGDRQVFFVNYADGRKTIGKVTTDANVATWTLDKNELPTKAFYTRKAKFKAK